MDSNTVYFNDKKQKEHKSTQMILTILICSIAILFAQIGERKNSELLVAIGFAAVASWSFLCEKKYTLAIILFLIPDNSLLELGGISIQLIVMAAFLVRGAKEGGFHKNTIIAGLLISLYSVIYISIGVGYVLLGVKLALMIQFFTEYYRRYTPDAKVYKDLLLFSVLGDALSIGFAILTNPDFFNASRIALSENSNWNLLGIWSALLFSHCFALYFIYGKKCYLMYSALMLVSSLLTTSRTAVVVLVFCGLWTIFFINKKNAFLKKAVIIVVIALVAFLVIFGYLHITYLDKIIDRIINPRRGDISNGRFTLWMKYINYLIDNKDVLLFGYGTATVPGMTTLTGGEKSYMAHNMLIEQITMYGIVGTLFVFNLYRTSIRAIKKAYSRKFVKISKSWVYAVNILAVFVAGMFSHVITSVFVTTELFLGFLFYYSMSYKGEINER